MRILGLIQIIMRGLFYLHKLNLFIFGFISILLFTACTKEEAHSFPIIIDSVNLLNQKEKNYISNIDVKGASMIIYTIDSCATVNINKKVLDIWSEIKRSPNMVSGNRILIVASQRPNCAYIFYENNELPINVHGYGSKEYFLTQISETTAINKKIYEMIQLSMNSYILNDSFVT